MTPFLDPKMTHFHRHFMGFWASKMAQKWLKNGSKMTHFLTQKWLKNGSIFGSKNRPFLTPFWTPILTPKTRDLALYLSPPRALCIIRGNPISGVLGPLAPNAIYKGNPWIWGPWIHGSQDLRIPGSMDPGIHGSMDP